MDESLRLDPQAARLQWRRRARLPAPHFLRGEVERGLLERLEPIRLEPRSVLIAGCGQSSLPLPLRQRFPGALLVAVEDDGKALAVLRDRVAPARGGWLSRLRGGRGPQPALYAAGAPTRLPLAASSVDLALSSLALHACARPADWLAEWLRVLRPGGVLAFACLGVDTLGEIRALGARMPPLPDMHDLGDALVRAGFAEPVVDTERLRVTWRSAATLIDEVRQWGGNAAQGRFRGLLTPRHRDQWLASVDALRGADGLIALSVEVIYGHAWCPSQKPLPDGLAPVHWARRGAGPGP
ncbi:MAG: methyltransferase domain-containing protein [Betaproteobacteria bacterium]|jgi:malonyl-CoA O-methyltransferase